MLLVAGVFLAREFERDLDRSIDRRSTGCRREDIAALVKTARSRGAVLASGERYAQVYAADGELLASTGPRAGAGCSTPTKCERADRTAGDGRAQTSIDGTDVRVRGVPATLQDGQRAVVVVGDSLRQRDSSLTSLNRLLLIALPARPAGGRIRRLRGGRRGAAARRADAQPRGGDQREQPVRAAAGTRGARRDRRARRAR